ncbi:aminopeptidase NAALADL1-like isoform X2 [Eriocheir sinensis]|uniref:aminopeptidase NAALADL1-like isoform X2 n=1 Tax=Eriocheir sinensis TaxID=95602 RepID=UPI0021C8C903|nr:aminopeptidase NAALADL1-like isoform X2 [Eriocheir sinensis]
MSGESYTRWRCAASDEEEDEGGGAARADLAGRGAVTIVTKPRSPQLLALAPAAQARVALAMVLVCAVCAAAGVWAGWAWGAASSQRPINLIVPAPRGNYNHSRRLLRHLKPDVIKAYMRKVSEEAAPLLGTLVEGVWREQGYETTTSTFTADISKPDPQRPNTVEVVYVNGSRQLLNPSPPGITTLPFSAYSPAGEASGCVVYGFFGRREDLSILQSRKVTLGGCILLLRHGEITTGAKVRNAAQAGASAVLVYPDPADGLDAEAYPEGPGLPGDGVLWESLATTPGDPTTPFTPSLPHVYRRDRAHQPLPRIPAQAISAEVAQTIFKLLAGPEVPAGWAGGVAAPYTLGGSWGTDAGIRAVTMTVNNVVERQEIKNIHATMPASDESRVVMVGCHYGSLQGRGHTAAGLGALLALSDALAKSHLPRGTQRKVIFSAWAKGEDGSLGSTEFTQLHAWWVESSVLAYLDLDSLVRGTGALRVGASPALRETIREAARQVPWPGAEGRRGMTVRDGWRRADPEHRDDVHFHNLGSGSDTVSFTAQHGVPSARFAVVGSETESNTYPLQHSQYDGLDAHTRLLDPTLAWTHMITSLVGATTLVLSESEVPPLLLSELGGDLYNGWEEFVGRHEETLAHSGYNFTAILDAIEQEILTLVDTLTVLDTWYKARPFYVRPYPQHYPGEDHRRQVEQRLWWLANLERGLLGPRGVGRTFTTHLTLGPDPENPDHPLHFPHAAAAITSALLHNTSWGAVHQELSYVLAALASYRQLFPSDLSGEAAGYNI